MIEEHFVWELLRESDGHLYHREGQELEFKEQFNLAGLADYYRDFAAFANNRGGFLVFGVTNSPRRATGLGKSSLEQFERIDPERISGDVLEIFSTGIEWEQCIVENHNSHFGVFRIYQAVTKPIIAKKDEGKSQIIKNGEIYYKYGGRTQKIQYAELQNIINRRVEQNNQYWLDLMAKIGKAGPENAAILDTERGLIEKDDNKILVLDDRLAANIKFIKQGEFVNQKGAPALQLIGDVVPVSKIEVVRKIKENLTKLYPYSARELCEEIQKILPSVGMNEVWQTIKDNDIKSNTEYSAYNFRNKKQEDEYDSAGKIPVSTPSLYNRRAVDFLVRILRQNS